MAYLGNPVETTLPVSTENILDGTIQEADLDAALATKINSSVSSSAAATLTNKTISLGSNSISGTLAQFNAAVSDADLVSISGTETLTNKTLTYPVIVESVTVISANTTAVASGAYTFTASLTLTLPASPVAGQWVKIIDRSGTLTSVIARNGQPIMGLAEDFTCDIANFFATFLYVDGTRGWVLI